jgi:hypothetical protein
MKLIEVLKAIEACDDIKPATCLTNGYHDELHPLLQQAVNEADGDLIDSRGGCNYVNHRVLAQHGFPVRCGERDSFGWLSGVIRTSKGDVVYG